MVATRERTANAAMIGSTYAAETITAPETTTDAASRENAHVTTALTIDPATIIALAISPMSAVRRQRKYCRETGTYW